MMDKEKQHEGLEKIILTPDEIITLNDYPVFSPDVLAKYFEMQQKGKTLPPVPVISVDMVKDFLPKEVYDRFRKTHPEARFVMLDGSHRTTAETLCGQKISVMVIGSDNDIKLAEEMLARGELFGLTIGESIEGCINELTQHFEGKPELYTVLEKTERMATEKVIPQYMIDIYLQIKTN